MGNASLRVFFFLLVLGAGSMSVLFQRPAVNGGSTPGGKGGSKARGPKVKATLRLCAARMAMGKSNMPTGLLLLLVTSKYINDIWM